MTRVQTPIDHFLFFLNADHGQKCYDMCTNAYWSRFSFSIRIILHEQVSFPLAQAKLLSGFFAPTSSISFLGPYLLFFAKMFQVERVETHPRGKAVQVSDPAIGLCRKIRRFSVGGVFEHRLFFVCWYPHRSTYLQVFSVPRRSWMLNLEAKIAVEHTRKKLEVGQNRLDLLLRTDRKDLWLAV